MGPTAVATSALNGSIGAGSVAVAEETGQPTHTKREIKALREVFWAKPQQNNRYKTEMNALFSRKCFVHHTYDRLVRWCRVIELWSPAGCVFILGADGGGGSKERLDFFLGSPSKIKMSGFSPLSICVNGPICDDSALPMSCLLLTRSAWMYVPPANSLTCVQDRSLTQLCSCSLSRWVWILSPLAFL